VVNVGFKSDGIISRNEFKDLNDLKVGDTVEVYLENVEDLDISYCRNITLSAIQYLKNIKTLNVMMSGVSNDIMNNYNLLDYTPKIRELFPNIKFVNIELPSQMEYYENY
jgi:hypothetical protein